MNRKKEKYDFRTEEERMQRFWEEQEIYRFRQEDSEKGGSAEDASGEGAGLFSVDTPPPTVSGQLHIGHVFSYTQAEIAVRYRRMKGQRIFYPFGFDDNGLPTERLVERQHKMRARQMPREEFRKLCMETVKPCEEDFRNLWKSLGFGVDWSLQYQTVSPRSQRISQRLFLDLVKKKKAYCKESPVLWCTECFTSIAQAELETKETETVFSYLRFQTKDGVVPVATTRPELLAGCVCLFVHPKDARYKRLIGKQAVVPLYGYEVPILADDSGGEEGVSMEKGSGAVMCATYGDTTDVRWCEAFQLPYREVIQKDGRIREDIAYIGGMKVRQAREAILQKLQEEGFLIRQEPLKHMVAVHDRCGTEVEIIPSRQWYIDILSEKERFLDAADEIRWHPEAMKDRLRPWIENLKWDWCISRQRYFGVPFPVWYCAGCGSPVFAEEDQLPADPVRDRPKGPCGKCHSTEFIPETAVFDTWATSSISPFLNAGYGEAEDRTEQLLPMSLRHQAHEIIRTWAFYTIVRSLYHTGKIPWKEIMVSGFVLAKPGEKISKSKNNAGTSPQKLIAEYGADAIRYLAGGVRLGTDTYFSTDDLRVSRRFLNKLYNASRFVLLQLPESGIRAPQELLPIDGWILQRVEETMKKAGELLSEYETGQARHEIDEMFWKDFCDYYIELVKERLYRSAAESRERISGEYALYHAFLGILKMYAVYVPHITESIYQEYFRQREGTVSIHLTCWGCPDAEGDYLGFGRHMKQIIGNVRRYKTEHHLSMKEPVGELTVRCPEKWAEYYRQSEPDLLGCTRAEKITLQVMPRSEAE